MPKLIEFTTAGNYKTVMINPLCIVGVIKEDDTGRPYIIYTPTPEDRERIYVTDSFDEIVSKVNDGLM